MHASTMTPEQLDALKRQVFEFFQTNKAKRLTTAEATAHFEGLGHTVTRPIEHTLQTYGVVGRPDDDARRRWPFPERDDAWGLEDGFLVPREAGC